jgi:hypothetical protein
MGTFDGMVPMSSEPPDPKAAARQVIEQHRQQLLDCGWRQGSVLPPELALQVTPVLQGYAAPTDGWPSTRHYIVVSQDCDVVQGDFTKEPLVEVVLATKKKPFDPYRSLRNPRVLHLELSDEATSSEVSVEIQAGRRGYIAHELLLNSSPASVAADENAVLEIAAFLARRYQRNARPELFDRRLGDAIKQLEELLADEVPNGHIFDVLFAIEPKSEDVREDEPYVVKVYGVLKDRFDVFEKDEATRTAMDSISRSIWDILLPCDGLDVDAVSIVGRSEIDIRLRERLCSLEIVWPRFEFEESASEADEE